MRIRLVMLAVTLAFYQVSMAQFSFVQGPVYFSANVDVNTPLAADIDADGHVDLLVGGAIYWGTGQGSLTGPTFLPGFSNQVADIDGDGDLDLVSRGFFSSVSVIENLGGRQFDFPTVVFTFPGMQFVDTIATGDLNGDGLTDLTVRVIENHPQGGQIFNVAALLQSPTGGYPSAPQVATLPSSFFGPFTADLTANGKDDIVLAVDDAITILELTPNGFSSPVTVPLTPQDGEGPDRLLFADVDRDGFTDVLATQGETKFQLVPGAVSILFGTQNGPGPSTDIILGGFGTPLPFDVSDFDGDQLEDLFFRYATTGTVILGDITGTPSGTPSSVLNPGFRAVVADFDEDGDPDYASLDNDFIALFLNTSVPSGAPPFPGTGEDLLLATATNLAPPTSGPGAFVKTATNGDLLTLRMDSPGSTFVAEPLALLMQFLTTGTSPQGDASFPSIRLDPTQVSVLLDGVGGPFGPLVLPPLGLNVSANLPSGLSGLSLFFQGFTLGPVSANGLFAATDAYEIRVF